MRHVASKLLVAHWNEVRRGPCAPDRNDLEPSAIGPVLQDVFILGAESGGAWRYRVAGTRLSGFANRELRNEPFERWWAASDRRDIARMLDGVAADDAPLVGGACGHAGDEARHEFELVLLPLRHGGRPGQRMLGGLFPSAATARRLGLQVEEMGLVSLRALGRHGGDAPAFGRLPAGFEAAAERRRSFRVIEGGAPG